MTTHVLRKGVGPFSAGTAVEIASDNHDGTCTIEIPHVKPSKEAGVEFEDLVFDIEIEYIQELRPRTREYDHTTRKDRRAGMKRANELIEALMEKNNENRQS